VELDQELIDGLASVNLTQNQAKVYVASLLLGEEASAYTLAKESKVPRSKIYEVIEKLVKDGYLAEIPQSDKTTFYVAFPLENTIDRDLKKIGSIITKVKNDLEILVDDYKGRVSEPPIMIYTNTDALLEDISNGEIIEAWIDNKLRIAGDLKKILSVKKSKVSIVESKRPLAFILGPIESFFIRGRNGTFFIVKFSNKIIQEILGLVEKSKSTVKKITSESSVKILRESVILNVEDKIKLVVPGFDMKNERILFWGTVDSAEGAFVSKNPCDCFITENRILLSSDDGRVFARALKFVEKIRQVDSQVTLTLTKVSGIESLKLKSTPYVPIIANLLEFIALK
jgi:sugar-specific transcriptional regulator TrmB